MDEHLTQFVTAGRGGTSRTVLRTTDTVAAAGRLEARTIVMRGSVGEGEGQAHPGAAEAALAKREIFNRGVMLLDDERAVQSTNRATRTMLQRNKAAAPRYKWSTICARACGFIGQDPTPLRERLIGRRGLLSRQSYVAIGLIVNLLAGCGGSGGGESTPPVAPTTTLNASRTSVPSGSKVLLTWSTSNAASCTATGAWSGSKPPSGSEEALPSSASSTYQLTCTGPGGTDTRSVTVVVLSPPTVQLSVSTPSVVIGNRVTLQWVSNGATSCTASGAWAGPRLVSGTESVLVDGALKTFTLTCNGDGGNGTEAVTVSGTQPSASATLAAGVRLLDEATLGLIFVETANEVTFSGDAPIAVGDVFITATTAHKAVEVRRQNGQTTIKTMAPNVEEIFESLRVKGTYAYDATHETSNEPLRAMRASSFDPPARAADAISGADEFATAWEYSHGGLSATTSHRIGYEIAIDYDYDSKGAGVNFAALESRVRYSNETSFNVKPSPTIVNLGPSKPLKIFRIPVPITLVDRVLGVLGIRLAAIYVPIGIEMPVRANYSAGIRAVLTGGFTADLKYWPEAGFTSSVRSLSEPTLTVSSSRPELPTGADPLEEFGASVSAYLSVAPTLMVLETVHLFGVDFRIGGTAVGRISVVEDSPPYCAELSSSVDYSIKAAMRVPRFTLEYPLKVGQLWRSVPEYEGSCALRVAISVASVSESPTVLEALDVEINVVPANIGLAGEKTPTGDVSIRLATEECVARLGAEGAARCRLIPKAAGAAKLEMAYEGDANFQSAKSDHDVEIARAATEAVVGVLPVSVRVGEAFIFVADVVPVTDRGVIPSGDVSVVDAAGNELCKIVLSAATGEGECEFAPVLPGEIVARGIYSGDDVFAPSETAPLKVSVTRPAEIRTIVQRFDYSGCLVQGNWGVPCEPYMIRSGGYYYYYNFPVSIEQFNPALGSLKKVTFRAHLNATGLTARCRYEGGASPWKTGDLYCTLLASPYMFLSYSPADYPWYMHFNVSRSARVDVPPDAMRLDTYVVPLAFPVPLESTGTLPIHLFVGTGALNYVAGAVFYVDKMTYWVTMNDIVYASVGLGSEQVSGYLELVYEYAAN